MAKMYPAQLNPDTQSEAEKQLYPALRDHLNDSYIVFHSLPWQYLDDNKRPRDGEADFIIAHPEQGILVLEVKGGIIRRDGQGQWTSQGAGRRLYNIKDPFMQARNNMYNLLTALEPMVRISRQSINIGYTVAVPHCDVPHTWFSSESPREIILDQNDLDNLSQWVGGAMAYYRGQLPRRDVAPRADTIQALIGLLAVEIDLRPVMWSEFEREERQFIQLTQQQRTALYGLNAFRRLTVSGCAGSGKTMLATEKAQRLAQQGFRVLFTCFNRPLALDLRTKLRPLDNLHIYNFHDLCYQVAEQAGTLPPDTFTGSDFVARLPEALLDALVVDETTRYDAIVVDEGQDFAEEWWSVLTELLTDPKEGILYIFYDNNQNLYRREKVYPITSPPYQLTFNCRNTQAIHNQILHFYQNPRLEELPTSFGPAGRPVAVTAYAANNFFTTLAQTLDYLKQERVPSDEIVILSPLRDKSQLRQRTRVGSYQLTEQWPPAPNQVYWSTIQAFKGLESKVVILVEAERCYDQPDQVDHSLYVACSRPRHHLIVLLAEDAPEEVRGRFTQNPQG